MKHMLLAALSAFAVATPAAATTTIIFESTVTSDFEFGGAAQFINGTFTFDETETAFFVNSGDPSSALFTNLSLSIDADILDGNGVSLFALESPGGAGVSIEDGVTTFDQVRINGGAGTYVSFFRINFFSGPPNAFTGLTLDVLSRLAISDFATSEVVTNIDGSGGVGATLTRFEVLDPVQAVPLPASLPLLLAGLGGFGALRLRAARRTARIA